MSGWRPGVIGCALSHLAAWRQIEETSSGAEGGAAPSPYDSPYDMFLVLEDDVRFTADFADRWQASSSSSSSSSSTSYSCSSSCRTQHPTPNTQTKTQHPKPQTPNPKPQIQDPKSKTQNPKPKIQNPKSKTQPLSLGQAIREVAAADHSWDILFFGNLDNRELYGDEPLASAPNLLRRLAPGADV